MPDNVASLQRQLENARENLKLIEERMAEYVLSTDVPLMLVREKRLLEERIAGLEIKIRDKLAQLRALDEQARDD